MNTKWHLCNFYIIYILLFYCIDKGWTMDNRKTNYNKQYNSFINPNNNNNNNNKNNNNYNYYSKHTNNNHKNSNSNNKHSGVIVNSRNSNSYNNSSKYHQQINDRDFRQTNRFHNSIKSSSTYSIRNGRVNEAVHAFHPSNNLHLRHSLQNKYNRNIPLQTTIAASTIPTITTTTTTLKPKSNWPIHRLRHISHHHHLKHNPNYQQKPFNTTSTSSTTTTTTTTINPIVKHPYKSYQHYNFGTAESNMGTTTISTTQNPYKLYRNTDALEKLSETQSGPTFIKLNEIQYKNKPEENLRDDYFNEKQEENEDYLNSFYENVNFNENIQNKRRQINNNRNGSSSSSSSSSSTTNIGRDFTDEYWENKFFKDFVNRNENRDDNDEDVDGDDDEDEDDDDEYDDLYLDDESVDVDTGEIGSLTEEKWRNYGTAEAVEKSRRQAAVRTRHQMLAHNATAHISRIHAETLCKAPKPRIIPINGDSSKVYAPHCTVLHRCSDDTGCCHSDELRCVPKHKKAVDLYFYVSTLGKRDPTVEMLTFENHTECHCIYRNGRMRPERNKHLTSTTSMPNVTEAITLNDTNCNCVKHYDLILETITSNNQNINKNMENQRNCRCDCEPDNVSCDWLKKGTDGFSIEDRRCIMEQRCTVPMCEYGPYMKKSGRCPKIEDRMGNSRNLFFD